MERNKIPQAPRRRVAIQAIDDYRCIRCGVCAQSCPNDVIHMREMTRIG